MSRKITHSEFCARLSDVSDNQYIAITEYKDRSSKMLFHCIRHDIDFEATAECFMRGKNDIRGGCPKCKKEKNNLRLQNTRVEVTCAFCGKSFLKKKSRVDNSRTSMHFCCREHKDLAQRIDSGNKFELIRPAHYNNETCMDYRKTAFEAYEHKCASCGWDEDERILEVHHIDSNRSNCKLDNLVILCPTCHRKITLGYYDFNPTTKEIIMRG